MSSKPVPASCFYLLYYGFLATVSKGPGHSGTVAQLRLAVAPLAVVGLEAILLRSAASHGSVRGHLAKLDLELKWLRYPRWPILLRFIKKF